ncbi:hypothetical protein llap_19974 [Limosa lapponica baueri]|uniref:Uncharacterized protein n=1 Tax=Limosa lapponica baueri TaxID=1758121 RepID=A0A2I0T7G2_LIMLA|nr:hypothetical protein llap_19974 [Limosa lapponica baueri]
MHHYVNSKDTSLPLKNTEENTKNQNPVNGLTDLQNTLPMSNRQVKQSQLGKSISNTYVAWKINHEPAQGLGPLKRELDTKQDIPGHTNWH